MTVALRPLMSDRGELRSRRGERERGRIAERRAVDRVESSIDDDAIFGRVREAVRGPEHGGAPAEPLPPAVDVRARVRARDRRRRRARRVVDGPERATARLNESVTSRGGFALDVSPRGPLKTMRKGPSSASDSGPTARRAPAIGSRCLGTQAEAAVTLATVTEKRRHSARSDGMREVGDNLGGRRFRPTRITSRGISQE